MPVGFGFRVLGHENKFNIWGRLSQLLLSYNLPLEPIYNILFRLVRSEFVFYLFFNVGVCVIMVPLLMLQYSSRKDSNTRDPGNLHSDIFMCMSYRSQQNATEIYGSRPYTLK